MPPHQKKEGRGVLRYYQNGEKEKKPCKKEGKKRGGPLTFFL